MAEKKEAVEALEGRIRALEGGVGAERQDLLAQLHEVKQKLVEYAAGVKSLRGTLSQMLCLLCHERTHIEGRSRTWWLTSLTKCMCL